MFEDTKRCIETGDYLVTRHARQEMIADNLALADVVTSVLKGEVIEDYPQDFPFHSCLVFGYGQRNEPIHTVWGYDKESGVAILITVYRPDPKRWLGLRRRR
jgi:hypothetical protein